MSRGVLPALAPCSWLSATLETSAAHVELPAPEQQHTRFSVTAYMDHYVQSYRLRRTESLPVHPHHSIQCLYVVLTRETGMFGTRPLELTGTLSFLTVHNQQSQAIPCNQTHAAFWDLFVKQDLPKISKYAEILLVNDRSSSSIVTSHTCCNM